MGSGWGERVADTVKTGRKYTSERIDHHSQHRIEWGVYLGARPLTTVPTFLSKLVFLPKPAPLGPASAPPK